jgi:purine nucleosidase
MTNVALAFVKEPAIVARLHSLVFMGGAAFSPGNMGESRTAEFNFHTDPHAAEIALSAGAPRTVMMGLDVTRKAVATEARIAKLAASGARSAIAAASMLEAYGRENKYLHDPTVIAHILEPGLFKGEEHPLTVDCRNGPDYGRSLVLPQEDNGRRTPVTIMTDIDADGYFALIAERLARLR